MAETKISDMTPGAALSGAEFFEMTQSAATFSTTATALKTFVGLGNFTVTEAVGSSALVLTGATQTVDHPVVSATQTWNAGGVTFTGIFLNVTNTASATASKLIDLQVGGVTQFNVTRGGALTTTGAIVSGTTLKSAGYTVATLPAGVTGARAYVTDSNAALTAGIGAIVAGGGANVVPVFYDGTNYRIG